MVYRKLAMAGVLSASLISTGAVHAAGLAQPILEPEVIAEETSDSSGFLLPLALLAIVGAVLLSGGGSGGSSPCCVIGPGDG